jgi:hypothetical protein
VWTGEYIFRSDVKPVFIYSHSLSAHILGLIVRANETRMAPVTTDRLNTEFPD